MTESVINATNIVNIIENIFDIKGCCTSFLLASQSYSSIMNKVLPKCGEFTCFQWHEPSIIIIWLLAICAIWVSWRDHNGRTSKTHFWFLFWLIMTFFSGISLYFIGYDYSGTGKNPITLFLRAILSAFEMFLSKSNLIGIAENCKENPLYMLLFSITHTSALALSTSVAIMCFWKRIKLWFRSLCWRWNSEKENSCTYIFWGINERNYILSKDIHQHLQKKGHKGRFILVDLLEKEEKQSKGLSFSGLLGLFSYKKEALTQISKLGGVLFRSKKHLSDIEDTSELFDTMDLLALESIMRRSKNLKMFILSEDESRNIKSVINLYEACKNMDISNIQIYASARRMRSHRLIEENCKSDKNNISIKFIDDSRIAINEIKMKHKQESHPINYVDVDTSVAAVTTTFNALVVGFGTTGQDALRFIYEFSAFPNKEGKKTPVCIDVVDSKMKQIEGEFEIEVPGISDLSHEIHFHHQEFGSSEFTSLLQRVIRNLNYVVVATGDDDRNLDIATTIFEYAMQHRIGKTNKMVIWTRLYNESNRMKFETILNAYKDFNTNISIHYFGNTSALYTYNMIIDDELERQAKSYYESYCEVCGDKTSWEKRNEKECVKLGSFYGIRSLYRKRGQDKANCVHAYTKEILLGMVERNNSKNHLPK